MNQVRTATALAIAIALATGACGKASKEEHRQACEKYADIHLESEFEMKTEHMEPAQKAEYRVELFKEFESQGKREAFAKRCLGETRGAKKTFVKCMDRATGLVDLNDCVRSHKRTKEREEKKKRDRQRKKDR